MEKKTEKKKIKILVNNRHKHFKRLVEDTICKDENLDVTLKKLIEKEDILNYDILFVASKFPECEIADKLIYLQIKFPTKENERQEVLDKFKEDYDFYISYLSENANVVIEKVDKKLTEKNIEVYNKTFVVIKPNNDNIHDRILDAFSILLLMSF